MRILLIFIILMSVIQLRPDLHGPDAENYYDVAKSLSFDKDLMFENEFEASGYPMTVSPTYHIVEQHQIGAPLIWMFAFDLLKVIKINTEAILIIVVNLVEYFLAILTIFVMFKILRVFFNFKISATVMLATLLGTNLFAYSFLLLGSAHISSILFTSLFLLFYFKTRQERNRIDWLILGGLAGLMAMMKGETIIYLIFPIYDLFVYFKDKKVKTGLISLLIFAGGFLFTFSPQLIFWQIIFGKIFRPYSEAGFFTGNKFLEVLFSPSRGFFFFSPLLNLCFLGGLFQLYKKEKSLAVFSFLIFLALVYGIGRAKYGWWQGCSFGNRYFLVFMPLYVLSIAACFERLSFKNQIIITATNSLWVFSLLALYIADKELESYREISSILNFEFLSSFFQEVQNQFQNMPLKFVLLEACALTIIFALALWIKKALKPIKIYPAYLKKLTIGIVAVIIIYIDALFLQCFFNDKNKILELKEEGFYKDAVFGDFDKGDMAGAYLEFTAGEMRENHVEASIDAARKVMHLYPPMQQLALESLYDFYTQFPQRFNNELLNNPDAYDYLGLSLVFYEKNDLANAKYYFQEAIKLSPGVLEIAKEKKNVYLNDNLDTLNSFPDKFKLKK